MATYTGVADANGDFTVPFSSSYNSGQKVTVTAEKGAATKTIELFAPSEMVSVAFDFTGSSVDFPKNIGEVTIQMSGDVPNHAFRVYDASAGASANILNAITKYTLIGDVKKIGIYAFSACNANIQNALLSSLTHVGSYAFSDILRSQQIVLPAQQITWGSSVFDRANITKVTIPTNQVLGHSMFARSKLTQVDMNVSSPIAEYCFSECYWLMQIISRSITPPSLPSNAINGVPATCKIKVPAESVAAYKAAGGWSSRSAYIEAI